MLRVFARCSAGLPRGWAALVGQAAEAVTALSVAVDGLAGPAGGRSHLALRSLVPGWLHPTRLETRTKECNTRASLRVANPWAQ